MRYNMNLDESYVPSWSEWECARELICNAMDADAHYHLRIYSDQKGLELHTTTTPTIEELLIIGASTSRSDEQKVGQFGEGFKMAALVATRLNGRLFVQLPSGQLSFELVRLPNHPTRVLQAVFDKRKKSSQEGCHTTLMLPTEIPNLKLRFCDSSLVMLTKPQSDINIFVKGVYITTFPDASLWDWNLNNLDLNRDRSVVDPYNVRFAVAWLLANNPEVTVEQILKIMTFPRSYECRSIETLYHNPYANSSKFQEAFTKLFGEKAVLASYNAQTNQAAVSRGYKLVHLPIEFDVFGIPTATAILGDSTTYEPATVLPVFVEEAQLVCHMLSVCPTIIFYKDFDAAPSGRCTYDEKTIWINERLTLPTIKGDERSLRLATIAHEIAHLDGDSDGTVSFEVKLSEICGKLLDMLLGRS